MVIYKIDKNMVGDFYIDKNTAIIFTTSCFTVFQELTLGPHKIPCKYIDELMFPVNVEYGERVRIGNGIYVEFGDAKKVYLDYELYKNIYAWTKTFKRFEFKGVEFVYDNYLDVVTNRYNQGISPRFIRFETRRQPIFVGDKEKKVLDLYGRKIRKGECRYGITQNDILLCYGDPE